MLRFDPGTFLENSICLPMSWKIRFFSHISCPGQGFPWSDRAETWSTQSSKIVFKVFLRIYWSVKFICYKYGVKGSKTQTSAGTPEVSRRPVQMQRWRRVLRTIFCLNNHQFSSKITIFWSGNASNLILEHFWKIDFFCPCHEKFDFFSTRFLSRTRLPVVRSSWNLVNSQL